MLRLIALTVLLATMPGQALPGELPLVGSTRYEEAAVNKNAMFKNWGVGSFSCASYVEAREFPDSPIGPYDATFRQWLMGFATAFNIKDTSTTDLFGRTSVERAMKWIEGYCRKNNDKEFFSAVWEFTKMAYPYRSKTIINMVEK